MGQVGSKVGLKGRFEDYFSMPSQPITQVELGPSKNIPEYLLMKHIRVIWQIETELDEWENVGQGFWYIPTENNLGYRLRVCVYQLQFVTNTSEPTPPEAIGQEWQITELDPNLINIRSILNPLECDPFDKILLTTLVCYLICCSHFFSTV
ncbi:hypothetical protein BLNAU_16168 [Blattamonas nauphoetae]|uniref:Uncharacterized protein n=1 Tax=Blattamonas nauphoetae TaxID=2049346 RepID=A0ABQ9XC80_9EUKA|nr:hypothetical protein BLNAU_16168 [Blattamonas nauphoetae]